jgi:succinate dehydrogenase/fumarate reductase flavoprotein subunit
VCVWCKRFIYVKRVDKYVLKIAIATKNNVLGFWDGIIEKMAFNVQPDKAEIYCLHAPSFCKWFTSFMYLFERWKS